MQSHTNDSEAHKVAGAWRWYTGKGSDALDRARYLDGEADRERNPRAASAKGPLQQGRAVLAGHVDVASDDPLDILVQCEQADEDEGCERGAHLEQYLAAQSNRA